MHIQLISLYDKWDKLDKIFNNGVVTIHMSMYRTFEDWLEQQNSKGTHRQILQLSMTEDEAALYLNAIKEAFPNTWLVCSDAYFELAREGVKPLEQKADQQTGMQKNTVNTCNSKTLRFKDIKRLLGDQCDAIIYNAKQGYDLNALHAASGLISHHGLLVILLPLSNQSSNANSSIKLSYGSRSEGLFSQLFQETLKAFNTPYISTEKHHLPIHTVPEDNRQKAIFEENNTGLGLSSAQQSILKQVSKHAGENRIDVILGARGRGKSTLLGGIAHALQHQNITLVLIAPNRHQLVALETSYAKCAQTNDKLTFQAPDYAVLNPSAAQVAIIDEVASIAPELIQQIILSYHQVILCGTSAGYEGSGQGFMQRLLPQISSNHKVVQHNLNSPFRWYPHDPIEAFFNHLMCNSKPLPCAQVQSSKLKYKWLNKADLLHTPNLYKGVFTLLQQAHYQTQANDILRIIESDDHHILIASCQSDNQLQILGVCICIIEGGKILTPLSNDIAYGKRRVQGHLSAQALSLYIHQPTLASHKYLRVSRIAVHTDARKKGIGTGLLIQCERYGETHHVNAMCTSFGLHGELLAFWLKNNFEMVKLGHRIDTASGTISALLIKNGSIARTYIIDLKTKMLLDVNATTSLELAKAKHNEQSGISFTQQNRMQQILSNTITHSALSVIASQVSQDQMNNFSQTVARLLCEGKIDLAAAYSAVVFQYQLSKNDQMLNLCYKFKQKQLHKHEKLQIQNRISDDLKNHYRF